MEVLCAWKPGVHCNASIQENEVGGSRVQGQPGLWSNIMSLKGKKERKRKGACEEKLSLHSYGQNTSQSIYFCATYG